MIYNISPTFDLIFNLIGGLWDTFTSAYIRFDGFPIPLSSIIIACIGLTFIVSAIWKGAKA